MEAMWRRSPVEKATESPSGVKSAKMHSPISRTMGEAEICLADSLEFCTRPAIFV